jgi:NADH-quinone oxidoreductase subunit C/D
MSEQSIGTSFSEIQNRFTEWVVPDPRAGYQGFVIPGDHLIEFSRTIRDEFGYDLLSSLTAVDYYPENRMDVVYHAFKTTGGAILEFKVQIPRDDARVSSLVAIFPGAEFQEREVWDLFGIKFEGHPDLRRILMWEGFAGHPLRKDWKEAYFEEDVKPYKSRWPDGHVVHAEERAYFGNNTDFPLDFDLDSCSPEPEKLIYAGLEPVVEEDLDTDQIIVNLGPQHPSTHGVFRMVVRLEGETVVDLKPVIGYLHRNHEKIGERNSFLQNMPFTDRLDYISSMSNNFGYALAVEKLIGVKPPERAEYLRVIMAELTRINSHLISVGFLLNDLGAYFTPALYALKERELILDIFEAVSGSRMMCNYFRFGGVVRDLPDGIFDVIHDLVHNRLNHQIDEIDAYLTGNEVVRSRCEGVGVLTPEQAIALSATGPILRASGVPYDIRRADPYSIYERFEFDVPTGIHGDIYDRYLVRLEEMRQSVRILKQALKDLPEGPVMTGKPQYQVRVPAGESYGRVEAPKGELGYYIVSNGKINPVRYHVRAPSFVNINSLATMACGSRVADTVAILGSLDIVLGEVDR